MSEMTLDQVENSPVNRTLNYWHYYHLKQSPFEDYPQFAMYFPVAHWQYNLKYMQQFCLGPRPILLVEGEFGIGKSMLLAQFITQLSPDITCYQLKGRATITPAQLIAEIAQGFQLPLTLSQPTLQEQMAAEINTLQRLQKTCLLVIDDADLLPAETLAILINFATAQDQNHINLYIILACELDLQQNLENIAREHNWSIYFPTLTLTALNFEETKNYIKHRLVKAGLTAKMPFTKEMLSYIHELSAGVPGRINRVAQQILIDLLKPNEERIPLQKFNERTNFSLKHHSIKIISVVVLLGAILGVVFFQMQKPLQTTAHNTINVALDLPLQKIIVAEQTRNRPTASLANPQQLRLTEAKIIAGDIGPTPFKQKNSANVTAQLATAVAKQQNNSQPLENVTVNKIAATSENSLPKNSSVQINSSIDSQKKTPVNIDLPIQTKSLTANEKKLLTLQGYTLQVLGSRRPADLTRFIATHRLPTAHMMQFQTEYLGKPWYVLVYGNYNDVQQAKSALNRFPKTVRVMHPWVRPMASVHQAIKQKI